MVGKVSRDLLQVRREDTGERFFWYSDRVSLSVKLASLTFRILSISGVEVTWLFRADSLKAA